MQQLYIVRNYLLVLAKPSKSEYIKLDSEFENQSMLRSDLLATTVASSLDYYSKTTENACLLWRFASDVN